MTIMAGSDEDEKESVGALLVFWVVTILIIGVFMYILEYEYKKDPEYQLRQYQSQIQQIERARRVQVETEAARLKLESLASQEN